MKLQDFVIFAFYGLYHPKTNKFFIQLIARMCVVSVEVYACEPCMPFGSNIAHKRQNLTVMNDQPSVYQYMYITNLVV